MSHLMLYTILIQIVVIAIIVSIAFLILRQWQTVKLEKRFESFCLINNNHYEISFFDSFVNFLWKCIHKLSNLLKKSKAINDFSKKYERYISVEDKEFKSGIDYVSMKLLIAIGFALLNMVTLLIKEHQMHFMSCIITFIIGFFLTDIVLNFKFQQKKKQIEEDLLKAIIIMNNSFKSGKNIMQAIITVQTELDGPIADEFKKIYLDITYGLSLDVVFNRFYERVKLEDAKSIASSLTLLNKTGGNIVRVFASIEKSFFAKKQLKNELRSLTSASVFVFRVLLILPIAFSLLIFILNPAYFSPLFTTSLGIGLLLLILCLYGLYIIVIKKVLKVKM